MGDGWSVRPFVADDRAAVLRLLDAVGGFDASVPPLSEVEIDALVGSESTEAGALWRVATNDEKTLVAALCVRHLGTKRTRLTVAVNPAFRRRGIGSALIAELPTDRRLLSTTRASLESASAFLQNQGFEERHRDVRLRRPLVDIPSFKLPAWAQLVEDETGDPKRYVAVAKAALDDPELDEALVAAHLQAPKARAMYLQTPQGDQGVVFVRALDRAKRSELDETGISSVGLLRDIGLSKSVRGKGLSRPLMRAGLDLMVRRGGLPK